MAKPVVGILKLSVEGTGYEVAIENFTVGFLPERKEHIEGTKDQFKIIPAQQYIKGTILVTASTDIEKIANATSVPVQLDTGVRSVVMDSGTNISESEWNVNDSKLEVHFVGSLKTVLN